MFNEKLKDALDSVGGGEAVILMGFDGIPLGEADSGKDLDMETVGMEFSVVLKEVRKATEMLEAGSAEEITVTTEQLATVFRVVNDEYFLALALTPGGNIGKARYVLRLLAPDVLSDLT